MRPAVQRRERIWQRAVRQGARAGLVCRYRRKAYAVGKTSVGSRASAAGRCRPRPRAATRGLCRPPRTIAGRKKDGKSSVTTTAAPAGERVRAGLARRRRGLDVRVVARRRRGEARRRCRPCRRSRTGAAGRSPSGSRRAAARTRASGRPSSAPADRPLEREVRAAVRRARSSSRGRRRHRAGRASRTTVGAISRRLESQWMRTCKPTARVPLGGKPCSVSVQPYEQGESLGNVSRVLRRADARGIDPAGLRRAADRGGCGCGRQASGHDDGRREFGVRLRRRQGPPRHRPGAAARREARRTSRRCLPAPTSRRPLARATHFAGYPPSSPSIALLRDGKLVCMLERRQIENQHAEAIAARHHGGVRPVLRPADALTGVRGVRLSAARVHLEVRIAPQPADRHERRPFALGRAALPRRGRRVPPRPPR